MQFRSINIDLIYGLPKQTPDNFARTVEEVIKLQPDRLSVFNYAHLPERFMPQRRIDSDELPAPARNWKCCNTTIEQLTEAGYRYIGMDHFALPDDELAIAQEEGDPATQLPGLHHPRPLRPDRPGRVGDQPDRRLVLPEQQ